MNAAVFVQQGHGKDGRVSMTASGEGASVYRYSRGLCLKPAVRTGD